MDSHHDNEAGKILALRSVAEDPKFASEVLLAEYRTLREEILKKMDHRTSMVVCSVTVSSAVLGFGIDRQSGPLLLVSPLVSLLLGILIVFHNVQIGECSDHLRKQVEDPLFETFQGFYGWHRGKSDPKYRVKQRIIPYLLPLILIATAPAMVAVPLALANMGSLALSLPVLTVDVALLAIYATQLIKHRTKL
ncbi:hypothetical protein ACFQ68_30825 [Amycolatopsis japonica]|uniref:hypothetical protein n=1 Tax=Amycolatopsis japonica TaxID=208439 RepID=UPI00366C41F1